VTDDIDPRFGLANERTFLAWVRTAVALIAGGVALEALDVGIGSTLRTALAVALVAAGGAFAVVSWHRWRQVERAIAAREPMPRLTTSPLLAGLLVVVAAILVVGLLV
jgi:putative membrane protein